MKKTKWKTVYTAIAAAVLFSGCKNQGGAPAQSAANLTSDKILTITTDQAVDVWDPGITYGADSQTFINTYEQLLYINKDGTYDPWLAESWEENKDGTEWTFHLRKGVKFHDGSDFTSSDVKFSYERTIALDRSAVFLWAPLEKIETPDDYTVTLKLKYPADMREVVACQYAAYIYSEEIGDDLKESSAWFSTYQINGTGPYTLKEYVPGSRLVLTKFDDYWGGWDGDHVETIVYRESGESSTRRQMIEGGEADIAFGLVPTDMEALADNDSLVADPTSGTGCALLFFNVDEGPTADKKVRQALAYSFPVDDVVDHLLYGKYASPAVDMIAAGTQIGAADGIPYHYDLDKAKQMLEEAGYKDGMDLTVSVYSGDEVPKKACEQWQSALAQIGVNLKIEANSYELVMERAKNADPSKRADIHIQLTVADTSSAYSSYASSAVTDGGWNFSGFGDPQLDDMINQVSILLAQDYDAGLELLGEVQKQVEDECFCVNAFDVKELMAYSRKVNGFDFNPFYTRSTRAYNITKSK